MRITLYVPSFPKLSETFIVSKFLGLIDQGCSVNIVCGQSSAKEWQNFKQLTERPGIRRLIHVQWRSRPHWVTTILLPLRLIQLFCISPKWTFRYLVRGRKRFGFFELFRNLYLDSAFIIARPDVIHFEFGALAVGRTYLKEVLGCKLVVSFRGYDLNLSGLDDPHYYQEVWEVADCLHLLGGGLWERAQKRGCPPDKSHFIIPPSIDISFFENSSRTYEKQIGTNVRPLRILSVGRLEWEKGYEFALQAILLLVRHNIIVEYRIVGEGRYIEAVAFCCHQLGLGEVVTLVGSGSREAVREQMQWADVLLHAAVSEGFCNAVLEAQAMQLPVVTSDAGGLSENVEDGITGFVVPRRNAVIMAEKVLQLCRESELRQRMGQAGRARVTTLFNLPRQIEAFVALYRQNSGRLNV